MRKGNRVIINLPCDDRYHASNIYAWSITEAYQALVDGIGDAITAGSNMFSGTERTSVIKYRDAEVGERVRKYTLDNIKPEAVPRMQKTQDKRREEEQKHIAEYGIL